MQPRTGRRFLRLLKGAASTPRTHVMDDERVEFDRATQILESAMCGAGADTIRIANPSDPEAPSGVPTFVAKGHLLP